MWTRRKETPGQRGGSLGLEAGLYKPGRGECKPGGSAQASRAAASLSSSTSPVRPIVDLGSSITG